MGMGKKIVFGTAITLALLLSGCGESVEDKVAKENRAKFEFSNRVSAIDHLQNGKNVLTEQAEAIKKEYEKEYGIEKTNLWFEEIKKNDDWKNRITDGMRMKY